MRILIVAMTDSIHTSRWVSQISDQGWDVHIFPSVLGGVTHSQLKNVIIHDDFLTYRGGRTRINLKAVFSIIGAFPSFILSGFNSSRFHVRRLARLINNIKPDIIHTLEFQSSAYLMLNVERALKKVEYKWIATNWGSDIYYFGRFPEHEKKIRQVLLRCGYYSCESHRDVLLARRFGFKGKVLPVFPNAGGFDLKEASSLRKKGLTSDRRNIMLKGYHGWSGRALVGLKALEKCVDLLKGYTVFVYSISDESRDEIMVAINRLRDMGVSLEVVAKGTSHKRMLELHGNSRVSIGLSITDGISTSFLEAIVMGSFPIQSSTACADEWIKNGESGYIVPPEDLDSIVCALRSSLVDDGLVNKAAQLNYAIAEKNLDAQKIKRMAIENYLYVANN